MKRCNLCKEEKRLIGTSHIFPDFLHSELYDEKHRLIKFNPEELKKVQPKVSRPPTANYEGNILCNKCDNETIGRYETYVSNLLKGNLKEQDRAKCKEILNSNGVKILEIENIDYNKMKLFLLSLLWRAHISSKPEYASVNLGPYAEKIRIQLFDGIAAAEDDIQISIFKFDKEAGFSTFIGSPLKHKTEQSTYYSIIVLGYVIIYFLKDSQMSTDMKRYKLKEDGKLAIWQLPKQMVGKFVMGYSGVVKNLKL